MLAGERRFAKPLANWNSSAEAAPMSATSKAAAKSGVFMGGIRLKAASFYAEKSGGKAPLFMCACCDLQS